MMKTPEAAGEGDAICHGAPAGAVLAAFDLPPPVPHRRDRLTPRNCAGSAPSPRGRSARAGTKSLTRRQVDRSPLPDGRLDRGRAGHGGDHLHRAGAPRSRPRLLRRPRRAAADAAVRRGRLPPRPRPADRLDRDRAPRQRRRGARQGGAQRGALPGRPYGRPVAGTVEGLRAITLEDVKAHYARQYTRGNLLVGLAGGDLDALTASIREDFKVLPARAPRRPALPPAPSGDRAVHGREGNPDRGHLDRRPAGGDPGRPRRLRADGGQLVARRAPHLQRPC